MNFEMTAGLEFSEVMDDDRETLTRARLLVKRYGLEDPQSIMRWEPRAPDKALDAFI